MTRLSKWLSDLGQFGVRYPERESVAINRKALVYAWHGSGRKWDALWLQSLGGVFGGFVIWYWGLKVPQAILDNPALGAVVAIIIGAAAGAIVVFLLRLCWWPFYWRLEPHGGLFQFLQTRLGTFMWPVVLTTAGVVAFIVLSGVGLVWLSLQVLSGASVREVSATPNTIGNPDFFLLPPEGRYRFTWPSDRFVSFYVRLDTERNPDMGNNPAFILRNRTNTVAYRVSAVWKSETSLNIKEEVTASPKLSVAQFAASDIRLDIIANAASGPRANFVYYLKESPKQTMEVVAKEADVFFPQELWPLAAIYLAARIPDKIGETSAPFVARVTLNWETSEGKRQRAYRVKITATNAKGTAAAFPIVDAFLNFSLEEIG